MGPGNEGDQPVEKDDAHFPGEVIVLGVTKHPAAMGDIGLAVEDRLDQVGISAGRCWPSASRSPRSPLGIDHQPVAGAQCGAAAAVYDMADHDRPVGFGDFLGAVT